MWIRHQKYFKRASYIHVFDCVDFNLIFKPDQRGRPTKWVGGWQKLITLANFFQKKCENEKMSGPSGGECH